MKKPLMFALIGLSPSLAFAHGGHAQFNAFHFHGLSEFVIAAALGLGAYLLYKRS